METSSEDRKRQSAKSIANLLYAERNKYILLLVISILIFVVLWVFLTATSGAPVDSASQTFSRILMAIGGAFLTSATVHVFIAWIDEDKGAKRSAQAIHSIFSDPDGLVFSNITDHGRSEILKNTLKAPTEHGNREYGEQLGVELGAGYFGVDQSFRNNFNYTIDFKEYSNVDSSSFGTDLSKAVTGINQSSDQYYWVQQRLRFSQHGFAPGTAEQKNLNIQLAFLDETLREMIEDKELLFREVIPLLPEHAKLIEDLDPEALHTFVEDVLHLKLELGSGNGDDATETEYAVRWENRSGLKCIHISATNNLGAKEGLFSNLSFSYPSRKSITHFVVTAPRPLSKGAKITFNGNSEMPGLSYIPFVTQFSAKPYDGHPGPTKINPTSWEIDVKRWWFPTSGVVFVWESKKFNLAKSSKTRKS